MHIQRYNTSQVRKDMYLNDDRIDEKVKYRI